MLGLNGATTGQSYSWLSGADGVLTQPALPALPEQFVPATSTDGQSLRGVGFRSGTYTDTRGVTPLTGAPTTEQNGVHTTLLVDRRSSRRTCSASTTSTRSAGPGPAGQTKVVVTPAQYRSDSATTNTVRTYSNVGLSLFYSSNTSHVRAEHPCPGAGAVDLPGQQHGQPAAPSRSPRTSPVTRLQASSRCG